MTDKEWEFVVAYLLLCGENSGQAEHELRAMFNGVRSITRTGSPWAPIPLKFNHQLASA